MGINCSCLNDITSLCSEDLSRQGNNKDIRTFINNNPKKNLTNYSISEKYDPMMSQRNTSNEIYSINSNQIDSSRNQKSLKSITIIIKKKQ